MAKVSIRFLHRTGGTWQWKPSPAARKLGFKNVALGSDERAAIAQAEKLNDRYKARRDGRTYAGSFNHLRDIYCGNEAQHIDPSREWANLADASKVDYTRYIKVICDRFGTEQVSDMDSEIVAELHKGYAGRPYAGNQCVKVLRTIMDIAIARPSLFPEMEERANPCSKISLYGSKEGIHSRERVWTDDEIAAFDKVADPEILMARKLFSYTGQRTADVLAMREADYRVDPNGDRWLYVAQQKTSKRIWVYCHADLVPAIEAHIAHHRQQRPDAIGVPLLQNTKGKKMNHRVFVTRWDRRAVKAGIVTLAEEKGVRRDRSNPTRHDLRRTAVTRLAEAGCTEDEISSVSGLSIMMIRKQVYNVRSKAHSKAGMKKLEDSRRG